MQSLRKRRRRRIRDRTWSSPATTTTKEQRRLRNKTKSIVRTNSNIEIRGPRRPRHFLAKKRKTGGTNSLKTASRRQKLNGKKSDFGWFINEAASATRGEILYLASIIAQWSSTGSTRYQRKREDWGCLLKCWRSTLKSRQYILKFM